VAERLVIVQLEPQDAAALNIKHVTPGQVIAQVVEFG
jgi:hypothetical protein